jgi:DNA primase
MIPESVLSQIQDRVDIVELVGAYVPLKRAGRNFKAPCPFHQEKTPSFMVSPDKQIFHCFGCGAGGNVFGFLMKQERKDFREAVEMLADRVGVEIPKDRNVNPETAERAALFLKVNGLAMDFYHRFLLERKEAQRARDYLKKRGISSQTILDFKLGWAPETWDAFYLHARGQAPDGILEKAGLIIPKKDGGFYDRFRARVIFPILDSKGICVAFGGRVIEEALPKYLNSPETEAYSKGRNLYGLFQARKAIRDLDCAMVVEGYLDLIACHQAGVQNVAASLGTALTPDQARLIKRHTKNIFILYDADAAGEMATLRGLEICLEEGLEIKIVRLPEGHDPDSFIRERGVDAFKEAVAGAKTLFEYKLALLKNQHDARALEGRVKIAGEMVRLFAKTQNEILKSAWTQELAKQLGLSAQALKSEMSRSAARAKEPKPAEIQNRPAGDLRPVERLLIGLMLDETVFLEKARQALSPEDFENPKARAIVRAILESDQKDCSAGAWMNVYKEDPESVGILSTACAQMDAILDKQKTFSDCVAWLRRARMDAQRELVNAQIKDAQKRGDKSRISQLLHDFHELNKGIRKTHEKK